MKLTKENVCVYIEDEAHLQEMREFLESEGEKITKDGTFRITAAASNYLQIWYNDNAWYLTDSIGQQKITTSQFKQLFDEK